MHLGNLIVFAVVLVLPAEKNSVDAECAFNGLVGTIIELRDIPEDHDIDIPLTTLTPTPASIDLSVNPSPHPYLNYILDEDEGVVNITLNRSLVDYMVLVCNNEQQDSSITCTLTTNMTINCDGGSETIVYNVVFRNIDDINNQPPEFAEQTYINQITFPWPKRFPLNSEPIRVSDADFLQGNANVMVTVVDNVNVTVERSDRQPGRPYEYLVDLYLTDENNQLNPPENGLINLTITASDGVFSDVATLTLEVTKINIRPPEFTEFYYDYDITDPMDSGADIHIVQAIDTEVPSNDVSYEIPNSDLVDIDSNGRVYLKRPANSEYFQDKKNKVHVAEIIAREDGPGGSGLESRTVLILYYTYVELSSTTAVTESTTACPTFTTEANEGTTSSDCPEHCLPTTIAPSTECPTTTPCSVTECPSTPISSTDCPTTECPSTPCDCPTTPISVTESPATTPCEVTVCPSTPVSATDCPTTPCDCPTTPVFVTDCPTTECPATGSTCLPCDCSGNTSSTTTEHSTDSTVTTICPVCPTDAPSTGSTCAPCECNCSTTPGTVTSSDCPVCTTQNPSTDTTCPTCEVVTCPTSECPSCTTTPYPPCESEEPEEDDDCPGTTGYIASIVTVSVLFAGSAAAAGYLLLQLRRTPPNPFSHIKPEMVESNFGPKSNAGVGTQSVSAFNAAEVKPIEQVPQAPSSSGYAEIGEPTNSSTRKPSTTGSDFGTLDQNERVELSQTRNPIMENQIASSSSSAMPLNSPAEMPAPVTKIPPPDYSTVDFSDKVEIINDEETEYPEDDEYEDDDNNNERL